MRVVIGEQTTGRNAAIDREEIAHLKILIAGVTGTTTTEVTAGEGRETVAAHQTPNEAGMPAVHHAPSRPHPRNLAVHYHLRTISSAAKWHQQGQEQTSFRKRKSRTGSQPDC